MGVDEILVHISGPNSKNDDSRFRAMAKSYAKFLPANVVRAVGEDFDEQYEPQVVTNQPPIELNLPAVRLPTPSRETSSEYQNADPPRSDSAQALPVYIEDTQMAIAALESQLWSGSSDSSDLSQADDASFSPLAERASKRQRMSLDEAVADRIHQNLHAKSVERFEYPLGTLPALSASHRPTSSTSAVLEDDRSLRGAHGVGNPTPLEDHPKKNDRAPDSSQSPVDEIEGFIEPMNVLPSCHAPTDQGLAASAPPQTNGTASNTRVPMSTSKKRSREVPEPAVPLRSSQQAHDPAPSKPPTLSGEPQGHPREGTPPSSAHPPLPTPDLLPTPSETDLPSGILSPSLVYLSSKSAVRAAYSPSLTVRPLRAFERGHWRVDTSSWNSVLEEKSWSYLTEFVRAGNGGWGLWCTREADGEDHGSRGAGWRVYCWGGTAMHIYLLLYVASRSEVRKGVVEWVDAAGEVVVRM